MYEAAVKLKQLNLPEKLGLLPKSEVVALVAISRLAKENPDKPVYASTVAGKLGVTAPAVSRTLNRLEEKKLIQRMIDQCDRRNVVVVLTEDGKSALDSTIAKLSDFVDRALSHLNDEEILQFTRLYNKIYEGMKSELAKVESASSTKGDFKNV